MALAIVVCNAFINAGLPAFTGSYADWAQTLIYLCEMTFTIAMTVGNVKGAQTLTSNTNFHEKIAMMKKEHTGYALVERTQKGMLFFQDAKWKRTLSNW